MTTDMWHSKFILFGEATLPIWCASPASFAILVYLMLSTYKANFTKKGLLRNFCQLKFFFCTDSRSSYHEVLKIHKLNV